MCQDNWTAAEEERQDIVDGAIFNLISELVPLRNFEYEYNIEDIAEIRDIIQKIFVDKLGLMTEQEFYPYRELDNDGNIILEPAKSEQGEMIIKSWDLEKVINRLVSEIDADDFAKLAGELLGGTCRYTDNFFYSFIPNEHYSGALDFTKESKRELSRN
jgi:hypothetical protein